MMETTDTIRKLEYDLTKSEEYIQHLTRFFTENETELEELRDKVKELQERIEKLTEEANINEKYINHVVIQFSNDRSILEEEITDLQEEILILKNRISDLRIQSNRNPQMAANSSQNVLDNDALLNDIQTHAGNLRSRIVMKNQLFRDGTQNSLDRINNGSEILLNHLVSGVRAHKKERDKAIDERDQGRGERD